MSHAPVATAPIVLPLWMNARRARLSYRLLDFAWLQADGKLCLTRESGPRCCRDSGLQPHELDRAIDDLFALKACDVRSDGLTDFVTFHVNKHGVLWRFRDHDATR